METLVLWPPSWSYSTTTTLWPSLTMVFSAEGDGEKMPAAARDAVRRLRATRFIILACNECSSNINCKW